MNRNYAYPNKDKRRPSN